MIVKWRRGAIALMAVGLVAACLTLAACGEDVDRSTDSGSAKQFKMARQIGYRTCVNPPDPERARRDAAGYAEELFGGDGPFDAAREAGCLRGLGEFITRSAP